MSIKMKLLLRALFKMFLNILLEISVLMTTCQMCAAARRWLPKITLAQALSRSLSFHLVIEAILREKDTPFWMISRPQSHTIRAPHSSPESVGGYQKLLRLTLPLRT